MDLSQLTIPMFPLNMVVLPGETVKLHIFEERYKQLVNDCIENEAEFGIPYIQAKQLTRYGSQVKIKKVLKQFPGGEMDILVEGRAVFRLIEFSEVLSPKLYGAGIVAIEPVERGIQSIKLQELIIEYFALTQNKLLQYDTVKNLSVYDVATQLMISAPEKYKLITHPYKAKFLYEHIRLILQIIKTEADLKDRFLNN